MKIIYFILSAVLVTSAISADDSHALTRVAFDVGSGGLKVTMADVDPVVGKIEKIHLSKEMNVPFKRDLHVNQNDQFSAEIQQLAMDTLRSLQEEFAEYDVVEWSGIATSASRQALNAQEMYDHIKAKLGIDIRIITQQEEGRLGFETAVAVSGEDRKDLISYDSGSGSFQIVTEFDDGLEAVEGEFAFIGTLSALVEDVRLGKLDQNSSPNPVTVDEAVAVIEILQRQMPPMPERFENKLRDEKVKVVDIGNENFIFATGAFATGKSTYTKDELWDAIERHCGLTDDQLAEFPKPHEVVIGMVLLYSVMDALGIDQITYAYANGSCEGVLIDPNYWSIDAVHAMAQ